MEGEPDLFDLRQAVNIAEMRIELLKTHRDSVLPKRARTFNDLNGFDNSFIDDWSTFRELSGQLSSSLEEIENENAISRRCKYFYKSIDKNFNLIDLSFYDYLKWRQNEQLRSIYHKVEFLVLIDLAKLARSLLNTDADGGVGVLTGANSTCDLKNKLSLFNTIEKIISSLERVQNQLFGSLDLENLDAEFQSDLEILNSSIPKISRREYLGQFAVNLGLLLSVAVPSQLTLATIPAIPSRLAYLLSWGLGGGISTSKSLGVFLNSMAKPDSKIIWEYFVEAVRLMDSETLMPTNEKTIFMLAHLERTKEELLDVRQNQEFQNQIAVWKTKYGNGNIEEAINHLRNKQKIFKMKICEFKKNC